MNQRLTHVLGSLVPILLSLITAPVTARSLGPENRGSLVQVLALGLIVSAIGNFGLPWAARPILESNGLAPAYLKRQSIILGLRFLPFALVGSLLVFFNKFYFTHEFWLAVAYLSLMSFSAYTGVCANHLLVSRKTASLGLVTLASSSLGFTLIIFYFLINELTLTTVLLTNCVVQLVNTLFLVFLSKHLDTGSLNNQAFREIKARLTTTSGSRRYAWLASCIDMVFSRFDVLFISVVASTYFLGLYSIPGILVGVCYSVFSTTSAAGFSSSGFGNSATKLRVSVQLNMVFVLVVFASAALLFPIALVPLFGSAFSESITLLPIAFGFSLFLCVAVPFIQYLLIRRSSISPLLGAVILCSTLAGAAFWLTDNPYLSAIILAWTLFMSIIGLALNSQPLLFSVTSKKNYFAFLKAS